MSYKLVIAEKPSVAQSIAKVIGADKREDEYLESNNHYLNRKLNSSTEYGTYNDYLWLDTGIRDNRNNPIMICLHNGYDDFVGHYTGTVRELANRLKQFKGNNGREIEKNLSRFMSKYKAKAE